MRSLLARLGAVALAPLSAAFWIACGSSYAAAPAPDEPVFQNDEKSPPRDSAPAPFTDAGSTDGDAAVMVLCDEATPFQTVTALPGNVNSPADDSFPTLTDDELTLYFQRSPVGGGNPTFFVAERTSTATDFGAPAALTELDDGRNNAWPTVTAKGDTLFFGSDYDIRRAVRGPTGRFGAATSIAVLSTSDGENFPVLFGHGDELWFSLAGGDAGIHLRRSTILGDGGFTAPETVPELDGTGFESGAASTRDGLTVYFGSPRTGGLGNTDVWMAHRSSRSAPFTAIANVPAVNSSADDEPGWLSADGCRLYMTSSRLGTYDMFVATRPPPPGP